MSGQGLQVTRDRVVSPPDRFIKVQDDRLLEYFQGVLGIRHGPQLSALYQLLEGITGHEFTGMRRHLEGDFAYFSAAATGDTDRIARSLDQETRLSEQESRFLHDFCRLMASAHYRLLGGEVWDAAQSEEFLFTLPVTVDWDALDDFMLRRHWAGRRAQERAALPDLADRILIFHRGVDMAKMQGLYLWTKMQLLISFYLLKPLWAGLAWLLSQLGLQTPAGFLLGGQPAQAEKQTQAPRTFHSIGTVANAAMRLRKAAAAASARQGVVLETSLTHDAAIIVERRTLNRAFPNGRAVLRKLFKEVELQEACFTDTVVLFRRKVEPDKGGKEGSDGGRHKAQDLEQAAQVRNIHIKHFKKIPLADLEMVMPEKHIYVPPSVLLQLAVAVVVAIGGLVWTLASAEGGPSWGVLGSAVVLLFTRASQLVLVSFLLPQPVGRWKDSVYHGPLPQVYLQAQSERSEIEREMNKLLFDRTAASQEAVLHTLTEEMTRQRIRELFVCYCVLLLAGRALSDEELDRRCERLLRKHFGLRIDFTAEEAIPALLGWGLVQRQPAAKQAKQQVLSQAQEPQALPAAPAEKAGVGRIRAAVAAAAQGWDKAAAASAGRGLQRVKVKAESDSLGGQDLPSSPSGSPRGSAKAPSVLGRRLSGLSREGSATTSLRVEHDAVSEEEKGDLLALPLDQALFMLDKAWDSVFDFHSGSKDAEVPSDADPPQQALQATSRLAFTMLSGEPGSPDLVGSPHHCPTASGSSHHSHQGSSNSHHSHQGSASSQQGTRTRQSSEHSPAAAGSTVVPQVQHSALSQPSPFASARPAKVQPPMQHPTLQPGPHVADVAEHHSDADVSDLQHGQSLTPAMRRAAAAVSRGSMYGQGTPQASPPRQPKKPLWHEAGSGNAGGLQVPAWVSGDEEALIPAEESREALERGFSGDLVPFTAAGMTAGGNGTASCEDVGAEQQMPSGQGEYQEDRETELVTLQQPSEEEEEPQWQGLAGLVEQQQPLAPSVEASAELAPGYEGGSSLPAEVQMGETWEASVQEESVGTAAESSREGRQPDLGQAEVGGQSPAQQAECPWEQKEGSDRRSQSESGSDGDRKPQVSIAYTDSEDAVWLAADESREGLLHRSGSLPQAGAPFLPAQYQLSTAQPPSPWADPTCQDFTSQPKLAPTAEPATSPGSNSPGSHDMPSSDLAAALGSAEALVADAKTASPAAASAKGGSPGATSRGGSPLQRSSSKPSSRQVAQVRGMWEQRVKSSSLPPSPKLLAAPQVRPSSAGPAYGSHSLAQSPPPRSALHGIHAPQSPPWEQEREQEQEPAQWEEWGRAGSSTAGATVGHGVSSTDEGDWYADQLRLAEQDGVRLGSQSQGRPHSANLPVRRSLGYGSSMGWPTVEGHPSSSALAGRLSRPTSAAYASSPSQPATDWHMGYDDAPEEREAIESWRQIRVASPRTAMAASPAHHHHHHAMDMPFAGLHSGRRSPNIHATTSRSSSDAGPGFVLLRSPLDQPYGQDATGSQRPNHPGLVLDAGGSYSPPGSPFSAGSLHSSPLSPGSGAGRSALLKLLRLRTELAAKRAHSRHSRSSNADELAREASDTDAGTLGEPAARGGTSTTSPRTASAALDRNMHGSPRIGSRVFHSYSPGHGFYVERP